MGRKRGVMRTECKDTRASHRKKRIGIGGNLMFMEGGIFPGYGKSYVNDDYVQAVKEAANIWSVPVIDLNAVSGLNPMIEEHLPLFRDPSFDRLHPNSKGHP